MKWPIVSRARLDLLLHNAEQMHQQAKTWQAMYEAEHARNERLVEKLIAMKKEGFATAAERTPVEQPKASPVDAVIAERAGGDPNLRRYLARYAQKELAKGRSPEQVMQGVANWSDPDEDG